MPIASTRSRDADATRPATGGMRLYLAAVLVALVLLHLAFLINLYDVLRDLL